MPTDNAVPVPAEPATAPPAPSPVAATAPVPAVPTRPAASPPKPMGRLKSAKALFSAAYATDKKEITEEVAHVTAPTRTDLPTLTEGRLNNAIGDFLQQRIRDGISSSTEEVALSRPIQVQGEELRLVLDNDLQLEKLSEIKGDLIGFLRSRFSVGKLRIEGRVAPSEVKRMPYTTKEKFDFLAEKNANLLELKRLFGLEIDF